MALKVTKKIKKEKEKKKNCWVVLDLRSTQTRGRPKPDPSIHPTCPRPFGSGGSGWLGLCSSLLPTNKIMPLVQVCESDS